MTWAKKRRLIKENVAGKVPRIGGVYRLHNKYGTTIYIGRSNNLRRRVMSYYGKDCFIAHPTKKALRREATHFSYKVMPKRERRALEKRRKQGLKHNHA